MKKNKTLWAFVLSLVVSGVGYFILRIHDCGIHDCGYRTLGYNFFTRVGNPLFYGMGALAIIFFVLIFIPKAIPQWKKFAKWFISIATLIFIFYPGRPGYYSPSPEQIFQWVSELYIFISLMIIGYSIRKS